MDTCQSCSRSLSSGRLITCSGTCGLTFHNTCVGLTKLHHSAWSAKVGLLWFCDACRLSFNPAVYNRENTIIKALRELLIRTDSMDTRLGNYGENLRSIKNAVRGQQHFNHTNQTLDQSTFHQNIDQLTLDDTTDPINRSRSCDETSFFEVLDEVNSTIAHQPSKLIVGNRHVQILPKKQTCSNSTKTALSPASSRENSRDPPINEQIDDQTDYCIPSGSKGVRPCTGALTVAKVIQTTDDMDAFYVTPFTPDQKEDDIKRHIHTIANVDPSLVRVVKLVPRGKKLDDLSFVSFKVVVCKTISNVIGDPWYWPDGITVRVFEQNSKNGSTSSHRNLS